MMVRKIAWFKIIKALIPVIRAASDKIIEAKEIDSDGGRKITRDEWEDIIAELLIEIVPDLARQMSDEDV
tara:strand:- start:436 stop:645 length:210 start_codon:yes stop_codon:yes gene_type:complete